MRLRRWLTDAQRYAVYTALHGKSRNGKLPKNATKEVAKVLSGTYSSCSKDLEVCKGADCARTRG